jgi:O-antigen/teichoic acid export membrane protein
MSIFKAAGKLATGNGISQGITLLGYMLLARVYHPEDFGLLGVIAGIGTIGGTSASLRYDFTILLPKRRRGADLATYAALVVALCGSIAFTLVAGLLSAMHVGEWAGFWWLIGPMVFGLAVINVLGFVQNREARYRHISTVQIVRSGAMVAGSFLLAGFQAGLVYGYCIGVLAGSASAVWLNRRADGYVYKRWSGRRVSAWLRTHRKFLKFSFPAVFVGAFAAQLPIFLISAYLGQQAAGYFSIIQRTVSGPTQLVSRAINRVYLQKLASMRAHRQPIAEFQSSITRKTFVATFAVSAAFAAFCLLGGYKLAFGSRWVGLDQLALILLPVMLVGFVSKCVASFAVLDRNELGLAYQLFLAVATFVAIYVPQRLGVGFAATLAAYSAAATTAYFVQIVSVHTIARRADASLA